MYLITCSEHEPFGNLEKFRWLPTAWREGPASPSLKRITEAVALPRLDVIIPDDLEVADAAVNGGMPFALTDAGPLGKAIRALARNYDPSVPRHRSRKRGTGGAGSVSWCGKRNAVLGTRNSLLGARRSLPGGQYRSARSEHRVPSTEDQAPRTEK